jgi:hypothetical protein
VHRASDDDRAESDWLEPLLALFSTAKSLEEKKKRYIKWQPKR